MKIYRSLLSTLYVLCVEIICKTAWAQIPILDLGAHNYSYVASSSWQAYNLSHAQTYCRILGNGDSGRSSLATIRERSLADKITQAINNHANPQVSEYRFPVH